MTIPPGPYETIGRMPALYAVLAMDGLHFNAARQALSSLEETSDKIDDLIYDIAALESRKEEAEAEQNADQDVRGNSSESEELEEIYRELEEVERQLGVAYGAHLTKVATVQLLAAAALEAHINIAAEAHLPEGTWKRFEWKSLREKWRLFPAMVGRRAFDENSEAFLAFSRLTCSRNSLTHYKPRRELWRPTEMPRFVEELGLNTDAAKESVEAVRAMIVALAERLEIDAPSWLQTGNVDYLEFEGQRWQG